MNRYVKTEIKWATLYFFLIFLPGLLFAQNSDNLLSELSAYKVEMSKDGRIMLEKAERALPGDVIEYQLSYKNTGRTTIRSLTPVLPIPEGMVFIPDTISAIRLVASLDGKSYSEVPIKREVEDEDGNIETVTVPLEEYRFLKWFIVELKSEKDVLLKARMQVKKPKADNMQ